MQTRRSEAIIEPGTELTIEASWLVFPSIENESRRARGVCRPEQSGLRDTEREKTVDSTIPSNEFRTKVSRSQLFLRFSDPIVQERRASSIGG